VALAYFGLLATGCKRDPEIGDEIAESLSSFRELTDYFVRFVLERLNGRVPALEAATRRYLHNRGLQHPTRVADADAEDGLGGA
jgi:hypothetical protein